MKIVKIDAETAKKIIDEGGECFLLITHDLERDVSMGRKRISKSKGCVLTNDSKTIVLNKDDEEEDSFSILSLYSSIQKDIFHIEPHGIKHDMILISQNGINSK